MFISKKNSLDSENKGKIVVRNLTIVLIFGAMIVLEKLGLIGDGNFILSIIACVGMLCAYMISSVSMLIAKKIYKDNDNAREWASIQMGIPAFIVILLSTIFLQQTTNRLSPPELSFSFFLAANMGYMLSMIVFVWTYYFYTRNLDIDNNTRIKNVIFPLFIPMCLMILFYFVVLSLL